MGSRPAATRTLRIATRGSPLARWQAHRVATLLAAVPGAPAIEPLIVRTTGDERADRPLSELGGQGVFVKEVQAAVLDGRADLAVHSAKDLPSQTPAGLVLAAVPVRGDPRDALVGARLADLPCGAVVATGSVRRRAQLAWLRPDLTFRELRGNMATRLARAEQVGAGVVALVALERLGLVGRVTDVLSPRLVLPQVGQGALAVECRAGDGAVLELLGAIDDARSRAELEAERAFLAALGGGCTLPAGALGRRSGDGLVLEGMLASRDGRVVVRDQVEGDDPVTVGRALAARLLTQRGGAALGDWAGAGGGGAR